MLSEQHTGSWEALCLDEAVGRVGIGQINGLVSEVVNPQHSSPARLLAPSIPPLLPLTRSPLSGQTFTMADKGRPQVRRKEKASSERTKDVPKGKQEAERAAAKGEAPRAEEAAADGAEEAAQNGDAQVEPMELPPFEIIQGDRIDPFAFKFQFKNVEYSSGRNKTFLCYLVDEGEAAEGLLRGYLEDEHTGPHAEEAFFTQCLQNHDPAARCSVTWYVSSSPCSSCAVKIAQVLKARTNVRLSIFAARLFEWEEPEIQAGLKALHAAGCKLRVMKPLDFSYTWETFVENEDQPLNLWEDCRDNYEFYQDKLADVLQ